MPLTNKEKQAAYRARMSSKRMKEIRGLWANVAEAKIIKKLAKDKLAELRK